MVRQINLPVNGFCMLILYPTILLKSLTAAAAAKSLKSCLTLCQPRDDSPPGSPVPGILQARTLEWIAISFSSTLAWKIPWIVNSLHEVAKVLEFQL